MVGQAAADRPLQVPFYHCRYPTRAPLSLQNMNTIRIIPFTEICSGLRVIFFSELTANAVQIRFSTQTHSMIFITSVHCQSLVRPSCGIRSPCVQKGYLSRFWWPIVKCYHYYRRACSTISGRGMYTFPNSTSTVQCRGVYLECGLQQHSLAFLLSDSDFTSASHYYRGPLLLLKQNHYREWEIRSCRKHTHTPRGS